MSNYNKGPLNNNYKHGMTKTRLHLIWSNMKTRCLNTKDPHYKWYGARGIKICPEWLDFIPFKEWAMSSGYNDKLTLDRINNDGDYCPNNCRWATIQEQSLNRRERSGRSGIPHIQLYAGGYRVQIRRGGKMIANRLFSDLDEAIAYRDAILTGPSEYEIKEAS